MKNPFFHGVATATLFLSFPTMSQAQTDTTGYDPFTEEGQAKIERNAQLEAQLIQSIKSMQIRVQVEFIDVSHEQFTELMFGTKPPATDSALRQQVTQLIKDGKANIVETLLCTSHSGRKASSESIEEMIYPTEYEPATLPAEVTVKSGEETEKVQGNRPDPAVGPLPTAFDTRNLGSTLEIEPILGDDLKTIDLRFVPEIVYHVGNEVWGEWKGEHGNSPVQMPTFYAIRTNNNVTLSDGQYMLTAALSPKNNDGVPDFTRKLMVFVKADVIKSGR